MAMTRLSDPTPRMTLSRALLSEALRLARSPLTAVHLVCGLAAGLACGVYFSVARWDPALGADAYVQFLGAFMPLMSAIVCGLAVDEERAAGRLANLTAVPSRGRAVAAKLLALVALGAAALAVALGVFGAVLAVAGRLPLGPAPLAAAWAGIVLGSLPLYALGLGVALRLGRNAAIGAGAAGVLLAFFSVGGLAHGLMTGELTGALVTPLSWVPLAFVIARYFAYAFAAVATAWLASFMVLFVAINAGFVYEAGWGPANAREVAEGLARDGVCGQQDVPTAYRYLILNKDGYVLMTDLESTRLEDATEMARTALAADPGTVEIEGGGSGLTYAAFPLKGGGACALVSEYLPQWVSRDLAGLLPNPQNLMLVGATAGSALALALVARRASRVISRKMAPLAEAAERVGAGELDFAVGSTNVREVNDVLAAMDAMRASLAESLEARWAAERGQREQMASLAHDLKTPLTVLRANADFVAEELEDENDSDLSAAARDIAGAVERLDGYVRLLIEASRGSGGAERAPMRPAELCEQALAEAAQIARARGVTLDAATGPAVAGAPEAPLDRTTLMRSAANLVANAAEHARSRVAVSCDVAGGRLVIEVADDGPGF